MFQQQQQVQDTEWFAPKSMTFPYIACGVVGEYDTSNCALVEEVKGATEAYKSVQSLIDIADKFRDFPSSPILDILQDSLQHAGAGVAETFFGNSSASACWGGQDFSSYRDELAVELMADDMTKVTIRNFGHTTNGNKSNSAWKSLVQGSQGSKMGDGLLTQFLIQNHGFQSYIDERSTWLPKVEMLLMNKAYILGTIVKQLTIASGMPVKMKIFILKALGSTKIDTVLNRWNEVTGDTQVSDPARNFVDNYNKLDFAVGRLDADVFATAAVGACSKAQTSSWTETSPVSTMPVVTEYVKTVYGSAVSSWLSRSDGPKCYGLLTGSSANNVNQTCHQVSPFGCFIGGTEVLLKRGTTSIEHLQEHDHIVGANGSIGTISSEDVVRTLEEETPIFGLNDGAPFFLASHPFWTQHGWRAVSPHSAKVENPWLEVGQLTEEDFVKRVVKYGNDKIDYEWVAVNSIHFEYLPAGSKVYGVHTREGPRSYHANGYLVMQNYPEITAKRIQEGVANLTHQEQKKLHDKLKDIEPILHKAVGPGPASAMLKLAEGHLTNLHQPKAKPSKVHLKEVTLPNIKLAHQAGKNNHGSYTMPSKLSLVRGHLFVEDRHVAEVHVTDDDKVSWTRPVADGKWEHGSLKLYPDRLHGHAFMSLTHAKQDSRSVVSATFAANSHENTYKCQVSASPIKKDTDKGTSYVDCGGLKMGTETVDGQLERVGLISLPAMEGDYDDLEHHVIFSVDEKLQLKVEVVIPTEYQEDLGYKTLQGTFSWDYSSFSGYCVQFDATKPANEGDHYAWRGDLEHHDDLPRVAAMHKVARVAAMKCPSHDQVESMHITPSHKLLGLRTATVAPMMTTMATLADNNLSLEHLFTLTPPDSKSVHDLTFSLIQKAMKYEMSDDDRSQILGVAKPTDMSGEMTDIADKYKTFFTDRFSKAYLMNGLSQSEHFKDTITEEERNKLLYFWMGNEDGCLGNDPDYNKINNEVARVAFILSCPDVKQYIDSDREGWAKKLFDKLVSPEVMNALALSTDVQSTQAILQKQSMVLYCLAPDKDYSTDFYKKMMMTRLNETSSKFSGDPSDEDVMKAFIKDYMHQLILNILNGDDSISAAMRAELQKQLEAAAEELNVKITDNNIATAKDMMAHMESFVDSAIVFFNSTTGTMMSRVTASMKDWMDTHPKLSFVGSMFSTMFTMAVWGMSLMYTIQTFMNWNNLDPEQKAELVINTVALTASAIAKVPDMIAGIKAACTKGKAPFKFVRDWFKTTSSEEVVDGIEVAVRAEVEAVEGEGVAVEEAMARAAAEAGDDAAEAAARWGKFFAMSERAAAILGVFAMVAGCVAMGFQIYRDFRDGAPVAQKVLDILQGVTLGIATVAATIGLFVSTACIPVIGIVCAVVGIVLAIVSLFIHRDPPKPEPTHVELYVTNTGKPFVDTIPAPSQKWLDDYHKHHTDD